MRCPGCQIIVTPHGGGMENKMKGKRQSKIIELINKYDIETQDDLIEKLRLEGFTVTQATVSRDMRDLKLTKITDERGVYKYVQPKSTLPTNISMLGGPILSSVTSADYAGNIVVIKTIPSMASAIAAGIDGMEMRSLLGCVAGDDCVIVISRTEEDASALCNRLRELIRLS